LASGRSFAIIGTATDGLTPSGVNTNEGAESTLFGEDAERWLKCVRNLCVEIHSPEAASIVEQALQGFQFEPLQSGEYNVYLNLTPKRAPLRHDGPRREPTKSRPLTLAPPPSRSG
jgi:hypothetical protein